METNPLDPVVILHCAYSLETYQGPIKRLRFFKLKKYLVWEREKQPWHPGAGLVLSARPWHSPNRTETTAQSSSIRRGYCVSRTDQDKTRPARDHVKTQTKPEHCWSQNTPNIPPSQLKFVTLAVPPVTTLASISIPSHLQRRFLKIPNQNYPTSWQHPIQSQAPPPWTLSQIT